MEQFRVRVKVRVNSGSAEEAVGAQLKQWECSCSRSSGSADEAVGVQMEQWERR